MGESHDLGCPGVEDYEACTCVDVLRARIERLERERDEALAKLDEARRVLRLVVDAPDMASLSDAVSAGRLVLDEGGK